MKSFVEYCKDYILVNLPEYEDCEWYGCDAAYELTEKDNVNGGMESPEVSKEYIKEWWDDCADFYEYYKWSLGKDIAAELNVFDDPQKFMFCMVYEGIHYILSRISIIDENRKDTLLLDIDTIENIQEEVEKVNSIEW